MRILRTIYDRATRLARQAGKPMQARAVVPALLAAVLMLSAGCVRRPLEDLDYNTRIRVKVNVDNISNVTCDIYNENIPIPTFDLDVMHVILFEDDSDQIAAESFLTDTETDEDGKTVFTGDLSIAPGTYRLYSYNFGTEATLIKDTYKWESVEAYALGVPDRISSSYATKVSSDESFTYSPDHLVVARSPQEVVPFHTGVHTIYTEARSVVESYYLQIKIDGLEYVNTASAVLSGMSSANYIALGNRVDDPKSTVWFEMQKSDDKGEPVICAIFNTFGHPDGSDNKLEVTFDIITKDGKSVQRSFDISSLFLTDDAVKHHWLLLDETITIDPPTPSGGSGGFEPSVDDWEDEHHDIIL